MNASGAHVPLWEKISWALNDFANNAFALVMVTAVYPLYFRDVVVGELGGGVDSDALWGTAISIGMAVVAVTSPFMGAIADRRRWRKRLLLIYTLVGVVATGCASLVEPGMIMVGLLVVVVGNIAFEGSVIFYDALLPGLVDRRELGRWSGFGWSAGFIGGLLCLIVCLFLAKNGDMSLMFLVVAGWWLLWSLPVHILVKDRMPAPRVLDDGPGVWEQLSQTWRAVRQNRDLTRFFIAFFLYNDGMATTFAFASLYATETMGFSTEDALTMLMAVQVTGVRGAVSLGFVADRIGHARTIAMTLVVWCVIVVAAYLVTTPEAFWVVALTVGVVMGATQSASRGFLASGAPPQEAGELFGFKAVAGRFSAVLGPLLFGWVSQWSGSQRIAILTVGVFFLGGLILMLTVKDERARLVMPSQAEERSD
ncbi:MAG: MFS transporter [Myxococcota bacterium]|nr:MFS transporter [Myxococcota bacterium]